MQPSGRLFHSLFCSLTNLFSRNHCSHPSCRHLCSSALFFPAPPQANPGRGLLIYLQTPHIFSPQHLNFIVPHELACGDNVLCTCVSRCLVRSAQYWLLDGTMSPSWDRRTLRWLLPYHPLIWLRQRSKWYGPSQELRRPRLRGQDDSVQIIWHFLMTMLAVS